MTVALDEPLAVVAVFEGQERQAQRFDGGEALDPEELFVTTLTMSHSGQRCPSRGPGRPPGSSAHGRLGSVPRERAPAMPSGGRDPERDILKVITLRLGGWSIGW